MIYVGFDPGVSGAMATIRHTRFGSTVVVEDLPVVRTAGPKSRRTGKSRTRSDYNLGELAAALEKYQWSAVHPEIRLAVVETTNARPGHAAHALWLQSRGIALIEGLLAGCRIPTMTVTPQVWKAALVWPGFGKDRADKKAAFNAACQLYPQAASQLRTPRGRILDGRAEALLIAHWGLLQVGESTPL